jgi:hypothetical protein
MRALRSSAERSNPKIMALYSKCLDSVRLEPGGHVVISHAVGVEPIFETGAPAVVAEHAPIPCAFDGRHFVVAGSSPGSHRKVWIRSNRSGEEIEVARASAETWKPSAGVSLLFV